MFTDRCSLETSIVFYKKKSKQVFQHPSKFARLLCCMLDLSLGPANAD